MVLKETPAAADAAAGVKTRSNTCFTTRSRPNGVNRAFLCTFIGGSLSVLTSWRHQLRLTAFNEQPIEKSHLAGEALVEAPAVRMHWRAPRRFVHRAQPHHEELNACRLGTREAGDPAVD